MDPANTPDPPAPNPQPFDPFEAIPLGGPMDPQRVVDPDAPIWGGPFGWLERPKAFPTRPGPQAHNAGITLGHPKPRPDDEWLVTRKLLRLLQRRTRRRIRQEIESTIDDRLDQLRDEVAEALATSGKGVSHVA